GRSEPVSAQLEPSLRPINADIEDRNTENVRSSFARLSISRFLLSPPESSQDLNRPFRNLTPGRFPFVNSTPARVSTVSITARLSGSPAYRPTSILLIVFR